MASIALRKALDDDNYDGKYSRSIHFDYFAVDFGEELSAVYGGVLDDQSSFTALAVSKILTLYADSKSSRGAPPSSVVLIGHSIGGVVAKAVFSEPEFESSQVIEFCLFFEHSPNTENELFWYEGLPRLEEYDHSTMIMVLNKTGTSLLILYSIQN